MCVCVCVHVCACASHYSVVPWSLFSPASVPVRCSVFTARSMFNVETGIRLADDQCVNILLTSQI